MNCRDFLIEFEDRRGELTEAATLHVKICAECRKTSDEQTRVWLMIDEMLRVHAPSDFDFRVKARIAQGKPAASAPKSFVPVLRYALPLGLAILVLGIFAFNANIFFGDDPAVEIVENVSPAPTAATSPALNFSNVESAAAPNDSSLPQNTVVAANVKPAAVQPETEFAAVQSTRKILTESRRRTPASEADIRSRDIAVTQPDSELLLPRGINPNRNTPISPVNNSGSITDIQILDFIGIEAVSDKSGKRVKAVKSNSLAERSGVKIGDLIEAIDDQSIGGESVRMKTSEAKKLTVTRDAKRIEIVLNNRAN